MNNVHIWIRNRFARFFILIQINYVNDVDIMKYPLNWNKLSVFLNLIIINKPFSEMKSFY
jgi:hypothetical protein